MSQDSYLGRIATTISLLKKDESLIPRAIAVFNTMISRFKDDPVPERDILPLLNLYFSYALKCGMEYSSLIKVFLSAGPKLQGDNIVFESFDRHHIGAQLKLLMKGVIPDTHTDSPMYAEMVSCLGSIYAHKVTRLFDR